MLNQKFLEYLNDIGMTRVLRDRVEEIYQFFTAVCPEELTDIFVSEFIKEDEDREYNSVWFFSASYAMEAKQFAFRGQDKFDMTSYRKSIVYWSLEKQDYNFKEVNSKSRFYLSIRMSSEVGGEFRASKENCDYLKRIFLACLLPNMRHAADSA